MEERTSRSKPIYKLPINVGNPTAPESDVHILVHVHLYQMVGSVRVIEIYLYDPGSVPISGFDHDKRTGNAGRLQTPTNTTAQLLIAQLARSVVNDSTY